MTREDAVASLVSLLLDLPLPAHVAVDGPDAAGKTMLADELARAIESAGTVVTHVSADDFLRPAKERHRRGRASPEGTTRTRSTTQRCARQPGSAAAW